MCFKHMHRDDLHPGSIQRFIFSNQDILIKLNREIYEKRKSQVKVRGEMDDDIVENQKYYERGLAFCEFYCSSSQLSLTKETFKMLMAGEAVGCMVYAVERATDDAICFLKEIALTQVQMDVQIPQFKIALQPDYVMSAFEQKKYCPFKTFTSHRDIAPDDTDLRPEEDICTTILHLDVPYEIYSECLNNVHHLNYNLNTHEFMCLRKSMPKFQSVCRDIEEHGMLVPVTFMIWNQNLVPIENSSRILMAILLKLPTIPACIVDTEYNIHYENMYHNSTNTYIKMNELLHPYLVFLPNKEIK